MAAKVGEEYGRSLAARMTPAEGQRTVRAAMHVVAETLTAHGFAAHAEDRGETTAVVAEQCPFGDASTTNPVLCAVDRGMVKGLLAGLCGDGLATGAPGRSSPRGPAATTPAPPRPEPRRGPRLPRPRQHDAARAPRRWPRSRDWAALPPATPAGCTRRAGSVRDALETARQQVAALLGVRAAPGRLHLGRAPRRSTPPSGAPPAPRPGAPVLCAAVEHSAVRDASAPGRPGRGDRRSTARAGSTSTRSRDAPGAPARRARPWSTASGPTTRSGPSSRWHEVVGAVPGGRRPGARRRRGRLRPRRRRTWPRSTPTWSASAPTSSGAVPGAGALVVRRGSRFEPLLVGGEQERGRRAGLETLPALAGLRRGRGRPGRRRAARRLEPRPATARRQIDALVDGGPRPSTGSRWSGPPRRRTGSPTWSASACTGSRPSRC